MKVGYAVEQRLRMIDFLLHMYGHVKREALVEYFGTGEATTTRDFKLYREFYPLNIEYSPVERCYVRKKSFVKAYD